MTNSYLTVVVSFLFRRKLRNELKRLKFIYYNLDWIENKGFVYSEFTIKSDDEILKNIEKMVNNFNG